MDAPHELDALLRTMRDDLIALALREGSSVLKQYLQESIRKYGEPRLTSVSLHMIEQAAGAWAAAKPAGKHEIGRWFRSLVAERLAGEGIRTLAELIAYCNRRGGSWWRSVPRIGLTRGADIRNMQTLPDQISVLIRPSCIDSFQSMNHHRVDYENGAFQGGRRVRECL